jgi:hypothetical protein
MPAYTCIYFRMNCTLLTLDLHGLVINPTIQLFIIALASLILIVSCSLWYALCKLYTAKNKVYEKNYHINDRLLYSSCILGAIQYGND